jgi:hypothetical protein
MISTGMVGTARHGTSPNKASWMRVNTLVRSAPPAARMAFYGCGEIELAAMEQWPAAMRTLAGTQIHGDPRL